MTEQQPASYDPFDPAQGPATPTPPATDANAETGSIGEAPTGRGAYWPPVYPAESGATDDAYATARPAAASHSPEPAPAHSGQAHSGQANSGQAHSDQAHSGQAHSDQAHSDQHGTTAAHSYSPVPASAASTAAPSTPASGTGRRSLGAAMALVLAGAGVGLGVGIGRATSGESLGASLADRTTTQADAGSATSGSTASGSTTSGSTGSGSTGGGSQTGSGSTGSGSTGSGSQTGSGSTGSGSTGNGSTGSGSQTPGGPTGWGWGSGQRAGTGTSTTDVSTPATSAQQVGVVDINTVLKYQSASAAGTGMVLTSDGEILTNNHVVNGATSITVTVVSTGKTYTATVVGTDATDDIAVLQLKGASGLAKAKLSSTTTVTVGEKVTGVGNAGGVGGTPSAATGKVTAVNQTITAADEGGTNAEKLTGLIETDANVLAGDSGGPLYNAGGSVIGIDTAGASTNAYSAQDQSYAIPISKALTVAAKIVNGEASSTIHIGSTAFLGISIDTTGSAKGALLGGVVAAGPAAKAGLVAGDVITSIGGQPVTSPTGLSAVLDRHHAGDKIVVKWTTATGSAKHATVTAIAGPAK